MHDEFVVHGRTYYSRAILPRSPFTIDNNLLGWHSCYNVQRGGMCTITCETPNGLFRLEMFCWDDIIAVVGVENIDMTYELIRPLVTSLLRQFDLAQEVVDPDYYRKCKRVED